MPNTTKTLVRFPSAVPFLLAIIWALPTVGTIGHIIDVPELVRDSDIIAVGRVASVRESQAKGTSAPPESIVMESHLVATLAVDTLLKGELETNMVSFEGPKRGAPDGTRAIVEGRYGIFFLRRGESKLAPSDPFYPFLPAVPSDKKSSGPTLDQIAARLGKVLTQPDVPPFDLSLALDALGSIQGRFAAEVLQDAMHATTGETQLRIAARLVSLGDVAALDLVESALRSPGPLPSDIHAYLAGSLAGLRNPRAIPALRRLLETRDEQVVWSVAIALRQTRSADALEPLAELLSSDNVDVRYSAVAGMGEITGQDQWTPTAGEFRQHESNYLSHWRTWAASNLPRKPPK